MQQAKFYNHAVKLPIQVIQTHISWVFLTGEYAYKLKKPVDFGFLDFSSLEKRKFFIEEELRLNKRIASDIYLEVLPISKKDNNYILDLDDNIDDYVLKMRQFPQETLLINMFKSGNLTQDLIKELGKTVANFHKNTPTNDYIKTFGNIEIIRESIDSNYQATKKYIGIVQTQEKYQDCQQFTDNFLIRKKNALLQRISEDKIRECHGDLHLKNICYWHDQLYLFDCIEFNEPFRFVDVIYDVAFTIMDLDARGRFDLGNIFLNSYLEETGDWQGVEVLPLYLCRQAYVRAKVTSFLLDDTDIADVDKENAIVTAKQYYDLAWQYTRLSPGKIILMAGLSGSGKSTIASKLAPRLNAIHIRSDAVRKHLADIPLKQKAPIDIYSQEWNRRTYEQLINLGILLAQQGFTIILDATYNRQQLRQQVITETVKQNISLAIIYCHAPKEILQQRLMNRGQDISDATIEVLNRQIFESFTFQEQTYVENGSKLLKEHNIES